MTICILIKDEEIRPTNPWVNDSGEKGKSVDLGVTVEFVGPVTSDVTVTKLKILISNVPANTQTKGTGHVDSKDFNGPQLNKPRPTWTRITWMDHGPGVKINEEPIAVLGKRGVYQKVQEIEDGVEKYSTKHSKSQNDCQCHAMAGVLDHPCRDQ